MGIVAIEPNGTLRAVYDDAFIEALSFGTISIKRASHVEFSNEQQGWFVDMLENSQLDIPAFRAGPFASREEALVWESTYLEHRLVGLSDAEACRLAGKEKLTRRESCHKL